MRRLVGSLDERLAQAEADRQHYQTLAAGAWKKTLDRTTGLEKELAAEIAARQKQPKVPLANKSLPDMLRLQVDVTKKLGSRRSALQAGAQALPFLKDPEHYRKQRHGHHEREDASGEESVCEGHVWAGWALSSGASQR